MAARCTSVAMVINIVCKPDGQRGFQVNLKQWVVVRISRGLPLPVAWPATTSVTPRYPKRWIRWVAVDQMLRRLTRRRPARR